MTTVKCDALTYTVPLSDSGPINLSPPVQDVLDACGVPLEVTSDVLKIYRCNSGGICRVSSRGRVVIVYTSGDMLTYLRSQGMYTAFLSAAASEPHRVTRLDCCIDFIADASPIVHALAARARTIGVSLSRKAVPPIDVTTWIKAANYDASVLTGTVYVGNKETAKVYLVCYDKRQQLIAKGHRDPGPLVRYELRVSSEFGPTMRDAYDPTALFWHFVAPDVLDKPLDVASWVSHAEGFTLDKLPTSTPMERAYRLLDSSPDIARLIKLAHEAGPAAMRLIAARLERMTMTAPLVPAAGTDALVLATTPSIGASVLAAPTSLQ